MRLVGIDLLITCFFKTYSLPSHCGSYFEYTRYCQKSKVTACSQRRYLYRYSVPKCPKDPMLPTASRLALLGRADLSGRSLPNAMVQPSCVTAYGSGAGYQYKDSVIYGFTHTNKGHWNFVISQYYRYLNPVLNSDRNSTIKKSIQHLDFFRCTYEEAVAVAQGCPILRLGGNVEGRMAKRSV